MFPHQGDIASCAGPWLYVWSINGCPVASVNTALGATSSMQQILCVAFSHMYEWDVSNVVMTGSSDGVVRVRERGPWVEERGLTITM